LLLDGTATERRVAISTGSRLEWSYLATHNVAVGKSLKVIPTTNKLGFTKNAGSKT
jgi:hypothetical protein